MEWISGDISNSQASEENMWKERKGNGRKGKETDGKGRKGKEREGKERKGRNIHEVEGRRGEVKRCGVEWSEEKREENVRIRDEKNWGR